LPLADFANAADLCPFQGGMKSYAAMIFGAGSQYCSGDYWLIPARTATNDIEWPYHIDSSASPPKKVYEFVEPHGVYQVYAPLAVAEPAGQGVAVHPLQRKINQLWS
jgi:hypothetical protein